VGTLTFSSALSTVAQLHSVAMATGAGYAAAVDGIPAAVSALSSQVGPVGDMSFMLGETIGASPDGSQLESEWVDNTQVSATLYGAYDMIGIGYSCNSANCYWTAILMAKGVQQAANPGGEAVSGTTEGLALGVPNHGQHAIPAYDDQIQQALQSTNTYRVSKGLTPVTLNPKINAITLAHSQDMAKRNSLDHNGYMARFKSIMKLEHYPNGPSENCMQAYNLNKYWVDNPGDYVVQAWIRDPPHRENIERPSLEMGLSYACNDDWCFWTQDFSG